MADRQNHIPGYSMPNLNILAQQQQQQQQSSMAYQQSQAAMNPAQQIPGVTNPDHQRMWQQIQDRHRAMGGADGTGQQQLNQQQMTELLRSQAALAQAQNHQQQQHQQQPPQLQQAQQFANQGGMAQMNNQLPGQNPLVAMQRQHGMPTNGMGGIPNTQLTPQMAQLLAAQRNGITNPAMIQMNRQLGLLNRAQKQQPQNGPTNFGPGQSFSGPQNLGQLPFQTGMFPPKPEDGRLPVPQGQQQFPMPPGLPNGSLPGHGFPGEVAQQSLRNSDGRPFTLEEIRIRAVQLKRTIDAERESLANATKNAAPEAIMALRERHREIQQKEVLFARMAEQLRFATGQQGIPRSQQPAPSNSSDGQGGGVLNSMGFPNVPQQQTAQHHMPPNQSWMPQMNNFNIPNQITNNGLPGNQQLLNGTSQNGQAQAPHQVNSPFHPNLVQSRQQQTPIPRSGPTPQQLQAFLQQNNTHSSPPSSGSAQPAGQGNFGQQGSTLEMQDGQHRPNSLSFPPLARDRFLQMLQEWWKRNGIKPDPRLVTIGNRQIDIHQLHTEVLQYGGGVNVRRHDLWNVIAAKMGWTSASISETGLTQDQIADQFKAVYEQLLESFEARYMAAAMKQSLTAPQPQQTTDHQGGSNQPSAGPSQPPPQQQQLSTQQAMHMIKLANMSTEQLRAAGYPDNLIQNIEQNRPALQATWHRMQLQRLQATRQQQAQQQQPPQLQQQQGSVLNAPVQFQNSLQAQTALHNPSSLHPQGGIPNASPLGHSGPSAGSSQSVDLQAQQRPQLNAQHLTPQNMQMLGILSNLRKPTMETSKQALLLIEQIKQEIAKDRPFRPEHVKHLSDAEKGAFPDLFEGLCNVIKDICKFLHLYFAATNDVNVVRGILSMLDMCDKQRQLVQSANPVYVLDVATLQRLMKTCSELRAKVILVMQQLRIMSQTEQNQPRPAMSQQGDAGLPHPSSVQQGPSPPQNIAPSPASVPPRPPTAQPQPPHVVQQNLRPPGRTPQMAPARPPSVTQSKAKAPPAISPNAPENAPSPAASTPLPSGATPSHPQASPQTPKSPKSKGQPKARPRQRRQSKVQQQANANAVPTTPAAQSAATSGAAASTSTPAGESSASPGQAAPSPKETLKRPREEDSSEQAGSAVLPDPANAETPSKRIKNDWENVPDAEPSKRQSEAESIKAPEDAANFFSAMTQILEMTNDGELSPELQETLAVLVKTVGNGLDVPDTGRNSSMSNLANAGTSSPKAADGDDSFLRFLDFTAFQQEDDKADTPELVPTSSTNPSPESGAGSEADHPPAPASSGSTGDRTKIVDTSESDLRADFFDSGSDPLRLGIWGEIDGGESSYFNQSDMWKWDGVPSSSGDNSWAIST